MAKIATTHQQADVIAESSALDATVNFSGALMEMLATTYVYILMAAIREAVQNGCDAARRAGLSFADGVQVLLPTPGNPMITIIDKGAGMTKAFMEADDGYLSFGTSTKSGDNGAAGGLGVGRWAAYGYIRECFIATCHAGDMVERTYFQFQGPNAKPKVQLAAEVPGKVVGTRVYFPVKDADIPEALRAVAWLKEVMQLTMGDSFSVDHPALLKQALPEYSGVPLELGEVDPGLAGVVVYPMQGATLKYGRQGPQAGSLVVLTNKEAGVGGLPFHVQSPSDANSVFAQGMVVEIPMAHNVPFMPSREELKYTDELNQLLRRIDEAALKAALAKVGALYRAPDLASKGALTRFLGCNEQWHWFSKAAREGANPAHTPLLGVTGGKPWSGSLMLEVSRDLADDIVADQVRLKFVDAGWGVMSTVKALGHHLTISNGKDWQSITFNPARPVTLVVCDVEKYGQKRFRDWLRGTPSGKFLFVSAKTAALAVDAVQRLNAKYGHALAVLTVSSMPEVERKVVGTTVVRATSRGTLIYWSRATGKQESRAMALSTLGEPVRLWLEKDGGKLAGFSAGTQLGDFVNPYGGGLHDVLTALKLERLYLLTPKQAAELRAAQASLGEVDVSELQEAADAGDDDARVELDNVRALGSWKPFELGLAEIAATPPVQDVLNRKAHTKLTLDSGLETLCKALAKAPRMELTGSRFDRAMAPFVDVLVGKVHLVPKLETPHQKLHQALTNIGRNLDVKDDDSDERKELVSALANLMETGHINYAAAMHRLKEEFPLLNVITRLDCAAEKTMAQFCQAMFALYR